MTTEELDPTPPADAASPDEPAAEAVADVEPADAPADDETPTAEAPDESAELPDAEPDADAAELAELAEPAEPAPPPSKRRWYVIKVASNREDSTKRNIERQVKIEGLEAFFGDIVIPFEEVVEVKKVTDTTKSGDKTTKTKKVIKKVKKYPGYVMAEVEWNAEVQSMLRSVSGVSDFVGAVGIGKPPPPMSDADVQRMMGTHPAGGSGPAAEGGKSSGKKEVVKLNFEKGDKVRIRDGAFANFEGTVKGISEPKEAGEHPIITVEVQVLGRGTSIEMEFWQVDKL